MNMHFDWRNEPPPPPPKPPRRSVLVGWWRLIFISLLGYGIGYAAVSRMLRPADKLYRDRLFVACPNGAGDTCFSSPPMERVHE
jgi:hypothetical protein